MISRSGTWAGSAISVIRLSASTATRTIGRTGVAMVAPEVSVIYSFSFSFFGW